MKKKYSVFLLLGILCQVLFFSGCATIEEPKHSPVIDFEARIKHEKQARKTWNRLLENAQSVDDAIKAKEHLERIQQNVEALEAGKQTREDIDAGFKSTKERTVVYGPIGWVFIGSKWVLDKLFIIYPWNWRAF